MNRKVGETLPGIQRLSALSRQPSFFSFSADSPAFLWCRSGSPNSAFLLQKRRLPKPPPLLLRNLLLLPLPNTLKFLFHRLIPLRPRGHNLKPPKDLLLRHHSHLRLMDL